MLIFTFLKYIPFQQLWFFLKTCLLFIELRTIKGGAIGTAELKTSILHRVVNTLLFSFWKLMNLLLVYYDINRLNALKCSEILNINEISIGVCKISGRYPVLSREETQPCSPNNTESRWNVFIRTRFDDWVFCVMREYH